MSTSTLANKLTIYYSLWKKLLALVGFSLVLWLCWLGIQSQIYILEVCCVLLAVYLIALLGDIINTRSISFYPEQIVKSGYLFSSTLPSNALCVANHPQLHSRRLLHGSAQNWRESINVHTWLIGPEMLLWLNSYQRNTYQIGTFRAEPVHGKSAACMQFESAAAAFRYASVLTLFNLLCYIFFATSIAWQYAEFTGYVTHLSATPVRLLCVGLALVVYALLYQLAKSPSATGLSYQDKTRRAQKRALYSALLINALVWIGLPLFLSFGNKLDYYVFLLVGICFYAGFYPRLTDWEIWVQTGNALEHNPAPPIPNQRRSMQVSLAVLSSLSMAAYLNHPNDFRIAQPPCQDPNAMPQACNTANNSTGGNGGSGGAGSGSGRYTRSSYGSRWDSNPSEVRRGGFGGFGRFFSGFGG
ncbi:hypothetical protein [Methylomonas sp. AM2-LC]|uniref:hypothetical protein n=1 Tax=Methylomonas sp. AM2-LC TaxID=3153301 RepID=UPI003263C691